MDSQRIQFEGLKHRTALVTGAARGIGRAIVEALAGHGVHLILSGRDQGRLDPWAQELRQTYDIQVLPQAADLADASEIETLIRRIRSDYDKLDILINNAAVTFPELSKTRPQKHGISVWRSMSGLRLYFAVNVFPSCVGDTVPA